MISGTKANLFLIRFRQILKITVKTKCPHLFPKAVSLKSREVNKKPTTTVRIAVEMKNKKSFSFVCIGCLYKILITGLEYLKSSYLEKL